MSFPVFADEPVNPDLWVRVYKTPYLKHGSRKTTRCIFQLIPGITAITTWQKELMGLMKGLGVWAGEISI